MDVVASHLLDVQYMIIMKHGVDIDAIGLKDHLPLVQQHEEPLYVLDLIHHRLAGGLPEHMNHVDPLPRHVKAEIKTSLILFLRIRTVVHNAGNTSPSIQH